MVLTRSNTRKAQDNGSLESPIKDATAVARPNPTKANLRPRKGRSDAKTPSRVLKCNPANAPPRTYVRTPLKASATKKQTPSKPPARVHKKNKSISASLSRLEVEAMLSPDLTRSTLYTSGSSKDSLGNLPITPSISGTSLISITGSDEPQSSSAYIQEASDAIITPRRKGRPYKTDLNDIAMHTPPRSAQPTKILTSTPLLQFTPLDGSGYRRVIRSDADLITPEAIVKRSLENQMKLQAIAQQKAREALTSTLVDDYDTDSEAGDVLPQVELSRDMDLAVFMREETPVPEQPTAPFKLGPEGTHIIENHWKYTPTKHEEPLEYKEEWVQADSRSRGLVPHATEVDDATE